MSVVLGVQVSLGPKSQFDRGEIVVTTALSIDRAGLENKAPR